MTKEQAIEIIENEIRCVRSTCDRNCGACKLAREEKEIIEAFQTAIENLKEKPESEWTEIEVVDFEDGQPVIDMWQSARCTNCNRYHTTPYIYSYSHFDYCPSCGCAMKR